MSNLRRITIVVAFLISPSILISADRIVNFKNGLQIRGTVVEITSIDQNAFQASAGATVESKPLWMIDDELRRTFVHQRVMVIPPANIAPADSGQSLILDQRVPAPGTRPVAAVGTILGITPFDEYGRRMFRMHSDKGPLTIHQGITEVHPRYMQVKALDSTRSRSWDMRMATEALSSKQLYQILSQWIDRSTIDGRIQIYNFLIQAKRYAAARAELQSAINDFPEHKGLTKQLKRLVQLEATQILNESLLRLETGQTEFASRMLNGFPAGVAIETRIKVEDAQKKIADAKERSKNLITLLGNQIAQLDPVVAKSLAPLLDEIREDLKAETLVRFNDYQRLGNDEQVDLENRIALAVGGWLLGSGSGEQNLAVVRSLIEVRRLIRLYLTESDPAKRAQLLQDITNQEGATPERVSKIIKTMKPPLPLPAEFADSETPGLYRMRLPARGEVTERTYLIQLPPEYDPLRSYPCVVSLHSPGRSLDEQITWWTGDYKPQFGMRMGRASRHGFIVIAPEWQTEGLMSYRFTPREHFRVLSAVRDALRRTSIDPNRVFLSGHSAGGTAAWDIALSHPDMWAGVIPISAESGKYIKHYSANGKYVPEYFVFGELAGYPNPLIRNGASMQRYLKPGYDAMIVAYKGRGEEDFYEEIDEIIEWMSLRSHERRLPPENLDLSCMRSGDQFFWWLELRDLKPAVNISPFLWENADRLRAGEIKASITADGEILITKIPADSCKVLISPEMNNIIDKRLKSGEAIRVKWGSKSRPINFDGNLSTMLEDVRTRGDRQRFYWAEVSLP